MAGFLKLPFAEILACLQTKSNPWCVSIKPGRRFCFRMKRLGKFLHNMAEVKNHGSEQHTIRWGAVFPYWSNKADSIDCDAHDGGAAHSRSSAGSSPGFQDDFDSKISPLLR